MFECKSGEPDWRDGRLVLRRPEARNSVVAQCYVPELAEDWDVTAQTLAARVVQRRERTPEQVESDLQALAALAASQGVQL